MFAGGVCQVAELRSLRWARVKVYFAPGRAWRSRFHNLRHPCSENTNLRATPRERKTLVCVVPGEARASEFQRYVGDSAETCAWQTPIFIFPNADNNSGGLRRHQAEHRNLATQHDSYDFWLIGGGRLSKKHTNRNGFLHFLCGETPKVKKNTAPPYKT